MNGRLVQARGLPRDLVGPAAQEILARHAREDLPNLLAELQLVHPTVGFRLQPAIGEDVRVRPLYNPALANALLDKFGYKKGTDGYRNTPDGKPLVFKYNSTPTALEREFDEQVVLVLEVVEDRAARQTDRRLQPAYRRLVVAVLGEATARAVEDLPAAGVQMLLRHLRHSGIVTI